ncbi:HAMP domain-containing sensor histidine kinase [Enterococcus sp. DIV0756]|uniref:HAMP domain-containing sensor histidine kinase n=1 Tax=Enterococcus sp. DIV0756 TaxID=2774636 RepID=UPI003F258A50
MRKKPKTLGRFLTKKYITTSLLLLGLLYILAFVAQLLSVGTNKIALELCAETIVKSDYRKIDTAILEDVGGWLEILDENNDVIYTKGTVAEKKAHYSQKQLLEMDGLQSVIRRKVYKIGPSTLSLNDKGSPYIATFAPFKGRDGREYLCIAKIPQGSILGTLEPTFSKFRSSVFFSIIKELIIILIPVVLIFIFCLKRYSKSVKEHIVAPNTVLINGLRTIKNGDFSKKIHLNAEYEYVEIEDSFNHMAKQLEEADRQRASYEKERQLLFANMAHDLRTPITTIQGSAKAVADGLVSQDKLNQTMTTIIKKSDHMNELVNRLLVFSKLESPDYQLQRLSLDVSEMIREALLDQLETAEKNQIEWLVDLPEEPLEIIGDPVELRRVFDNLIGNSIHHNPAGTIVQIQLTSFRNQVIFEIKDNGAPISKELQEHLFDPFVSGDSSRTTKNGSGLGLAISKKIVEMHGGKILFKELNEQEKMFQVLLFL